MTRLHSALLGFVILAVSTFAASAQFAEDDIVFIQIEAQPSLNLAIESAREYAAEIEDVNGFALGGGWYAVTVGPYRRGDAQLLLRSYVRTRIVPRDSYLQPPERFSQQFWPVGANVLGQIVVDAPETEVAEATTEAEPATEAEAEAETETQTAETTPPQPAQTTPVAEAPVQQAPAPDETVAEARRSERALNPQERRDLQVALKWAGFYTAAIDGAFGRGTRRSMALWQEANDFDQTGVLTTLQRAALLKQYNAVLEGLDLKMVQDNRAGIEMMLPTAQVSFSKVEPPFVHYDSTGDIGARVLLISQAGDQDTLYGLYDIMQTLEIVPLAGPRERGRNDFTLVGQNSDIVSETRVSLQNGQIKGFTLIWPAGDEERRTRVIEEMDKSFARLPGVLDPAAGSNAEQSVDLVSGLQIRKPRISRSGFFVDGSGAILTASEAVQSCTRVTIDGDTDAEVLQDDAQKGVAVLKPKSRLAPLAVASFNAASPRLQSEVSVAGYSFEGVLSAATLTFGTLADVRGLNGEEELKRLALKAQDGDTGGPVFDETGAVIGVLLPRPDGSAVLPEDVRFALDTSAVAEIVSAAGLSLNASQSTAAIAPRDLRIAAQGMTVLVSCWD